MMDSTVRDLLAVGERLFAKRASLVSYWQTVAENFYPERADFTSPHNLGEEFADHLTTSYPVIARRELAGALSAMMRPRDDHWFFLTSGQPEREDAMAKQWLEWATGAMRRAMYARATKFTRAMPQGDNDFATFGQCVITVEMNRGGTDLLYRCKHLRDVAWQENADDDIDTVFERWKPTARDLVKLFPKAHARIKECAEREPFKEIPCFRVIVPSEDFKGAKKWRQPFVSLYVDIDNAHVLEERGVWTNPYVIPRWQTVSGSQYAYSPATVAALPDARLIQAVTLTLLDAGEMHASPPMVAVQEAIRSDINLRPRGVTFVDADYDERLGEVLRPISQDKSGIPFGAEIRRDVREMIAEAFYLNKINLPPARAPGDMTAFEVGQRVQEYIRSALPLFEPMEMEFNGGICEATFEIGLRNGLFGPVEAIPDRLRGQEIRFKFASPLSEAIESKDAQRFMEGRGLLAAAAEIDPSLTGMVDAGRALRDALTGIGTPARWLRDDEQLAAMKAEAEKAAADQSAMQQIGQGAGVAQQVGQAMAALKGAGQG